MIFRKENIFYKKSWVATVILLFLYSPFFAQQNSPSKLKNEILESKKKQSNNNYQPPAVGVTVFQPKNALNNTTKTLIYLEHSNEWYHNDIKFPNIQILKGDVKFRHDDAILYCDSAYYNQKENTFKAFSNVKIVQGDTLTAYGDRLYYDGNSKLAQLQENVRMVNKNTTLTTETLYYDRVANLAYYFTGGEIKDGKNTLTSIWGEYSPATKIALFKNKVKMTNPKGVLKADTLKYYTNTSIADIVGNSHVIYKNETEVYSEKGWYDTKKERMMLLKRSLIEHKDGKTLVGDTIFYDKKNRFGEAFSKVELNDKNQKTTLYGNYISYNELSETGLATDSALFVDWSEKEKKLYMSADTLYTLRDSLPTDSIGFDMVKGYSNVRFYRQDLQGVCDTLSYTTRDSIIRMKSIPVVWSKNNQLKGKTINAFIKNKTIDRIEIKQSAIAIQKDTLNYYNQLAGKEIIAYMDSSKLKRVDINGNVETIYFPKDDKTKEIIGVNKTLSSFAKIYLKKQKIDKIVLTEATNAIMYPLLEMSESDLQLPYFHWFAKERPMHQEDVFTKYQRNEPPRLPQSTKRPELPGSKSNDEDEENKQSNRNKQNTQNRLGNRNINQRNSFSGSNSKNRLNAGGKFQLKR